MWKGVRRGLQLHRIKVLPTQTFFLQLHVRVWAEETLESLRRLLLRLILLLANGLLRPAHVDLLEPKSNMTI